MRWRHYAVVCLLAAHAGLASGGEIRIGTPQGAFVIPTEGAKVSAVATAAAREITSTDAKLAALKADRPGALDAAALEELQGLRDLAALELKEGWILYANTSASGALKEKSNNVSQLTKLIDMFVESPAKIREVVRTRIWSAKGGQIQFRSAVAKMRGSSPIWQSYQQNMDMLRQAYEFSVVEPGSGRTVCSDPWVIVASDPFEKQLC